MDHCIIYFSFAVRPFLDADISAILEQSRRNNIKHHVSGILLYVNGSIIQLLEGEQGTLSGLFGQIKRDPRHQGVSLVFDRPISERLFADWSMGYEPVTAQELANIKRIVNLYTGEPLPIKAGDNVVLKMIKLFYDSKQHQ